MTPLVCPFCEYGLFKVDRDPLSRLQLTCMECDSRFILPVSAHQILKPAPEHQILKPAPDS